MGRSRPLLRQSRRAPVHLERVPAEPQRGRRLPRARRPAGAGRGRDVHAVQERHGQRRFDKRGREQHRPVDSVRVPGLHAAAADDVHRHRAALRRPQRRRGRRPQHPHDRRARGAVPHRDRSRRRRRRLQQRRAARLRGAVRVLCLRPHPPGRGPGLSRRDRVVGRVGRPVQCGLGHGLRRGVRPQRQRRLRGVRVQRRHGRQRGQLPALLPGHVGRNQHS